MEREFFGIWVGVSEQTIFAFGVVRSTSRCYVARKLCGTKNKNFGCFVGLTKKIATKKKCLILPNFLESVFKFSDKNKKGLRKWALNLLTRK